MTQVCPVFGAAPVPTFVSSYWRPLGVFVILDSFSVLSCESAGPAASRIAAAAHRYGAAVFFIRVVPFWPPGGDAGGVYPPASGRRRIFRAPGREAASRARSASDRGKS